MKKEEIYVKLTDKNRDKVFKILDMFGQQLTVEDEEARKTGRYPNGTPIKDFPKLEFKTGSTWVLYQEYSSNTKTRIKPRELRNMLAQEHVVVVDNGTWVEGGECRIKPGEPKTTDGKKLARYGDVCKFYNTNPGVFVVGYLAFFGKAHNKKVYYCVGLDAPFYNAEPITKEEAIKLLFGNDLRQ